jgi:hypothetical protein
MSDQLNLAPLPLHRPNVARARVAVAAENRFGWPGLGLVVLLCSLALYPKSFSGDPDLRHVGIAQSVPAVAT